MTTRLVTRIYDTREDAVSAVHALEAAGMGHEEISMVGGNAGAAPEGTTHTTAAEAAKTEGAAVGAGATAGTIIGGGAGLLAGIGSLAIPGVGPVVAAGWLVATLTGAGVGAAVGSGAGGLIGALTHEGVSEDDAHVYAEGVRRGGYLVTARVEDTRVSEAQGILSRSGHDAATRRAVYEKEGWTGRSGTAAPEYETTAADRNRL